MTLLLADPARGATPTSVGDAGGGLGATGIAGVAIGLVTFPTQYVGIADNSQTSSSMNWLATNGSIPTLRNATRRVRVTVANGTMTVAIDGTIALTRAVTLPPTVLLGFTAGTGGYFDQHAVSAVSITTGGSAATGILSMTPSTIAFGTVTTGTTASHPVTITNAGNAALAFSSFTLPGTPFSVTGLPAAGTSLAAGATVVATITYAPTAATSAAAAFTVTTNVGVATTSLTGTGKAAPAVSTVTPTSINFGSVTRGAVATRTVTVANTGGSPLTITSVGAVAAPYSLSGAPAANTVLQAGQSVTFTVRFSPTVKGIKRATIVIKTSAGRTNVALTGTGT
jgi:iron transport multicopper oxidase